MVKLISSSGKTLLLVLSLTSLVGCSSSTGPSYDELVETARLQRILLNERDEDIVQLAAVVARETQTVADADIATGLLLSRKPYVGVRINSAR